MSAPVAPPWDQAFERSHDRAARRARGVFYTPPALVAYVVEEVLARPLARAAWRPDGSPRLRVLDPAAGAGRFLLACVTALTRRAAERGFAPERARRAITARCVVGVERDRRAAGLARAALGDGAEVRVGEALLGGCVEPGAWDVVVGNPPYLRSVRLKREDPALWAALRGRLAATSHGEWDLYAAFLERALEWAAPGGEVGLVVPSRWLTAAFAGPLRARLAGARAVRRVVDFGASQVFADATTYASVVFLTRRRGGARAVEVLRREAAVDTPAGPPDGRDPRWRRGHVAVASLGAAPWILEVGAPAGVLEGLRAAGPPLARVARIAKGAGTNADPIFLLDEEDARRVERDILTPCLRGRDVRPFAASVVRWALLPYEGDRLLPPEVLAARYPRAHEYLERRRAPLERREQGRFAGATFYRWGRPQNLGFHRDATPKVVVPDAAREGRAALDAAGTLVIDTAYAVRPLDDAVPAGLLLAVLNSAVVGLWLRSTGIPLRGGYFRMKTAYLASLPVPDPATSAARDVARRALALDPADDDARRDLADRVMALYRVTGERGPSPTSRPPRAPGLRGR